MDLFVFDFVLVSDWFDWNLLCIFFIIVYEWSISCVVVWLYIMQLVVSFVLWWFEDQFGYMLIEWCGLYFCFMCVGEDVLCIVIDVYGNVVWFGLELGEL